MRFLISAVEDVRGLPAPYHPTSAAPCAIELIEALKELVEDVPEAGRPRVSAGGALWDGELDETVTAVVLGGADAP
ncbi:hypothetical protein [Streptomyces niveus]|uniref:hypothetical protein n=1 Tax=Streptomyces niveus TaxID=193462 RepID=UPI0036482DCA